MIPRTTITGISDLLPTIIVTMTHSWIGCRVRQQTNITVANCNIRHHGVKSERAEIKDLMGSRHFLGALRTNERVNLEV